MAYDYREAVKNDVLDYINSEIDFEEFDTLEELEEHLNEVLFVHDSVTGNASGSYTFNSRGKYLSQFGFVSGSPRGVRRLAGHSQRWSGSRRRNNSLLSVGAVYSGSPRGNRRRFRGSPPGRRRRKRG